MSALIRLVVFGINIITETLYDDIKRLPDKFDLCAFTVDDVLAVQDTFLSLPVVKFSDAQRQYPPGEYQMLSAVEAMSHLYDRVKVLRKIKSAGYTIPNYVSPLADVGSNVVFGENNIVMSMAYVGINSLFGNANIIRQSTYLGHDLSVGDANTFIPGCRVGGKCHIGNRCTFALGSVTRDSLIIADDTFIGAGAVVIKSTQPQTTLVGNPARTLIKRSSEDGNE